MEATYCIFKVYDYKGGELDSTLNMSYNELLVEISEMLAFDFFVENSNLPDHEIINFVKSEKFKRKYIDQVSIYAGGDNNVFEIYKCFNNTLIILDCFQDLWKDIIENYIKIKNNERLL